MKIKGKLMELYKLKRFCTAKNTINNTEKQPSEWGKIFANKVTDKGLLWNTQTVYAVQY